jgi:hypothetical protein
VFTNEDMANVKGVVSVVGTPPPEPAAQPAAGAPATTPSAEGTPAPATGAPAAPSAETPASPAGTPAPGNAVLQNGANREIGGPGAAVRDEAYWRQAFAAARKKLADDTKELDILQREYNLKQQQFYSNPNVALREQTGRADLNTTLEQINTKKADVAASQQAVTNLEDELRRAGGNPGWSRPPTQ